MPNYWFHGTNNGPLGRRVSVHIGTLGKASGAWLTPCPGRSDRYRWGEDGMGAQNLAHAILYRITGNRETADLWCEFFATNIVAHLDERSWVLHPDGIEEWMAKQSAAMMTSAKLLGLDVEGGK